MKKFNAKYFAKFIIGLSLSLLIVFCPISLTGCKKDPSRSQEETMRLMIENTTQKLTQLDDSFMAEYQESVIQSSAVNCTANTEVQYPPHSAIDRGLNQYAYMPVSQMTISFGYYALCEYYLKYIPFFMGQTLYIEQTYYSSQQIWTKCTMTDSSMDIHIWSEFKNSFNEFNEYVNISVEYNKHTLMPTKFIHRENRNWKHEQDNFGYIEVDFVQNYAKVETLRYNTNDEINYSTAENNIIKNNIYRYVAEEFNFSNYANRTTKTYAGKKNLISEQEMLQSVKNFNYVYAREGRNIFDFENPINFKYGNNAMDFAFDKYLIFEDETTGELIKVRK